MQKPNKQIYLWNVASASLSAVVAAIIIIFGKKVYSIIKQNS